jgi:hypothetical protein
MPYVEDKQRILAFLNRIESYYPGAGGKKEEKNDEL